MGWRGGTKDLSGWARCGLEQGFKLSENVHGNRLRFPIQSKREARLSYFQTSGKPLAIKELRPLGSLRESHRN